jgi:PAS domain S-box-containing protein
MGTMGRTPEEYQSEIDALRRRIVELEAAQAGQARLEEALRGALFSPGLPFFDPLVSELSRQADADLVCVGELLPGARRLRSISLWVEGKIAPPREFDLEGSLSEIAGEKEFLVHPEGAARRFSGDKLLEEMGAEGCAGASLLDSAHQTIGLLVLVSRRPFRHPHVLEPLLRGAALRASAQLERARAEARFRSLFDSNMMGMVMWSSREEITDANDAFLSTVRSSREELRAGGLRWKDLSPSEFAEIDARANEEIASKGICLPYEKELFRRDGSRVPVLIGGSRVPSTPPSTVSFVIDLSSRRIAERAALESGDLNRQVITSIQEGLIVHDRNLRYVTFNPEMEALTGIPARDVLGKHPLEVFPALREMGIYSLLERALLGESLTSPDLPFHPAASGETRWTSTRVFPLRDPQGKIRGVISVVRDITGLKKVEEALRESQARLAEALNRTEARVVQLEEQVHVRSSFERLVGKSTVMQEVYRRLRLAAESDVTVLITGPSGTGKELAAAAIHSLSSRRSHPFVAVNCSSIPVGVLESELFGHVKGSFTGATRDKVGLFQSAEGGTLFLDEVGDMPATVQVKVLRALQEREIRRVGDDRPIRVDVRLVTATNQNLPERIAQGDIREDFYYRIRVFEIRLPSLRERRDDISLLVALFIQEFSKSTGKPVRGLAADALQALLDFPWPGNVRELRNAVEHAFVTSEGEHLKLSDFPAEIRSLPAPAGPGLPTTPRGLPERDRILQALQEADGHKGDAAKRLGISRVTLWKRMAELGLGSNRRGETARGKGASRR